MTDYTPDNPYPQRQLFLCEDASGRLCAASNTYFVSGPAESGGGTFFDWLTTADSGHTFTAVKVPVNDNFVVYYAASNTLLARNGTVAAASVARSSNRPTVLSTVGNRIQPQGSGEDPLTWQKGSLSIYGTLGTDRGYGELNVSGNRIATKREQPYFFLNSTPADTGLGNRTLVFKPAREDSRFTFCQQTYTESVRYSAGPNFVVYQTYDDGRTYARTAILPLSRSDIQYHYDPRYVDPVYTLGGLSPYMVPAKEGEPGAGTGIASRSELRDTSTAWALEAVCGGESADTLYAVGSYGVKHPDTQNIYFLYYLIKSMDCGLSWETLDPAAPAVVSETTYTTGADPLNYGYDFQPDGSYLIHQYPPIVFPVAGANGLPPCLRSQAVLPQGSYVSADYNPDTRRVQMVFAQGVLYLAMPDTLIGQLQDSQNAVRQVFSYALTAAGDRLVVELTPPASTSIVGSPVPAEAYGWVFCCSNDLGRTWEGLTSPPPMQYGALTTTQNGHRLHWGLHTYSDDGGHTWQAA